MSANHLLSAVEERAPTGAWLKPLRSWPVTLRELLVARPAVVRVVVAETRGSSPRETGASMLIDATGVWGTIGGGNLELQAIDAARAFLHPTPLAGQVRRWVLARELGQCCGGVVTLWMERYTRADLEFVETLIAGTRTPNAVLTSVLTEGRLRRHVSSAGPALTSRAQLEVGADVGTLRERLSDALPALWVFGAGHVGQAFIRIAAELPFAVTWIDSRAALFPGTTPPEIATVCVDDPVGSLARAPAGTRYLVMTHSHDLDYALCRAILERSDYAWVGVIGSGSKAARFRSRLAREGVAPDHVAALVSPIGVEAIASKWPAAIAVAVAAQLLQHVGRAAESSGDTNGVRAECDGDCAQCQSKSSRTRTSAS